MKKIVCEICGCQDVKKDGEVFICPNCGTNYSVEDAKKLLKEVEDTRKDELQTLYELARRAFKEGNHSNAEKYYSEIVVKNPDDWEANFYQVYCGTMDGKIKDIGDNAIKLMGASTTALELLAKNLSKEERKEHVISVLSLCAVRATNGFSSAESWYNGAAFSVRSNFTSQMFYYCSACVSLLYELGDTAYRLFKDESKEISEMIATCWKLAIPDAEKLVRHAANSAEYKSKIDKYVNKVENIEPGFKTITLARREKKAKEDKRLLMIGIPFLILLFGGIIAIICIFGLM